MASSTFLEAKCWCLAPCCLLTVENCGTAFSRPIDCSALRTCMYSYAPAISPPRARARSSWISKRISTCGCRRLATSSVLPTPAEPTQRTSVSKIRRQLGKPGYRLALHITTHLTCAAANPHSSTRVLWFYTPRLAAALRQLPRPEVSVSSSMQRPPSSAAPTRCITAPHRPYYSQNGSHSKPWHLTAGHT